MKKSIKKGKTKSIIKIPPNQYLKLSALFLIIFGSCLMPSGFIYDLINEETYSDEARFSRILLTVKKRCESNFSNILNSINDDPLDELVKSKLPNVEEIFLSEWANDWFPKIEIAIIGSIIEEIGSEMVGDVNLDNRHPKADLNISSHKNPTNLTLTQCKSLWDRTNKYSLTYPLPYIWFKSLNRDFYSQNLLIDTFHITLTQIKFICDWINTSMNGWVKNFDYLDDIVYMNYGFLGIGLIFFVIGVIIFQVENKRLKGDSKGKKAKRKIPTQ